MNIKTALANLEKSKRNKIKKDRNPELKVPARKYFDKVCEYKKCQKDYQAYHEKQKYCSEQCRDLAVIEKNFNKTKSERSQIYGKKNRKDSK